VTPETTLEFESFTIATSGEESAAPAIADCPLPDETAIVAAAPAEVVSVNVAGVAIPETLARAEFAPAVAPVVKVHWTCPEPFVDVVQPLSDPPPAVTDQETVTPETALELESFTTAMSAPESGEPAVPVCPLPEDTVMLAAAPAVAVSVNVAGVETPVAVAVTVFVPTVVPVVKLH
jgi:hypothetical protein